MSQGRLSIVVIVVVVVVVVAVSVVELGDRDCFLFLIRSRVGSLSSTKIKKKEHAVWGSRGMGELRCGGVAVWGSCGVGELWCR